MDSEAIYYLDIPPMKPTEQVIVRPSIFIEGGRRVTNERLSYSESYVSEVKDENGKSVGTIVYVPEPYETLVTRGLAELSDMVDEEDEVSAF